MTSAEETRHRLRPPPPAPSRFIVDATGHSGTGLATLDDLVRRAGFASGGATSTRTTHTETEVRYRPGAINKGELVFQYFAHDTRLSEDSTIKSDVSVVLGCSFRGIILPTGAPPAAPPISNPTPTSTLPNAGDSTAATSSGNGIDPAVFGTPVPKTPPAK